MDRPLLLATDLQQNATFSSGGKGTVYMELPRLLVQVVSIFSVWST